MKPTKLGLKYKNSIYLITFTLIITLTNGLLNFYSFFFFAWAWKLPCPRTLASGVPAVVMTKGMLCWYSFHVFCVFACIYVIKAIMQNSRNWFNLIFFIGMTSESQSHFFNNWNARWAQTGTRTLAAKHSHSLRYH